MHMTLSEKVNITAARHVRLSDRKRAKETLVDTSALNYRTFIFSAFLSVSIWAHGMDIDSPAPNPPKTHAVPKDATRELTITGSYLR